MELRDEELLQFWKYLNEKQVQYIMAGGIAMSLHGYMRYNSIVELLIKDEVSNWQKVGQAFCELGYDDFSERVEAIQSGEGLVSFHLGSGMEVEIISSLKGVELSLKRSGNKTVDS